tara:strand:+ start:247 stop:930 length:684 start_codon:yes stop_codon:yes gene_type:complete
MRKISILTILAAILTFSSCEEDAVTGCTDSTATNYDADATENDNSCVFSITGCTDTTALNFNSLATVDDNSCEYSASVSDQILGNWTIDSSTVGVLLPQDMLNMLIMMSSMMSPEEFEEEMGFPMPSSQAEWDEIALNGFTQDGEITGTISLTSTMFTLNDTEETMELAYELVNDDTIQFTNPDPDEDLEYFTIEEVSETNLTLTTSIIVDEEGMSMESILKIYLSK